MLIEKHALLKNVSIGDLVDPVTETELYQRTAFGGAVEADSGIVHAMSEALEDGLRASSDQEKEEPKA